MLTLDLSIKGAEARDILSKAAQATGILRAHCVPLKSSVLVMRVLMGMTCENATER